VKEENNSKDKWSKEMDLILEYISKVKYGSVVVNIQDGKIIQIEKNEKVRFKN
jgi:hypothetical protein